MKVLHVGSKNYPPDHGGTERVVFDIATGSENFENYILVEWEQEETNNIKVMPYGFCNKLQFITKFVKKEKIDIVHFHNEAYIPIALIYSVINRKTLLTIHGCHFTNPKYNWFQRISILLFDILGAIFLPRLVFCNEVDQNQFMKWVPFRDLFFVPNGVKTPSFQANENDEFKGVLVYLGRISPEKNLLRLIEASNSSEKLVHIYGAFDERRVRFNKTIKNAIKNSNYVEWKGSVPYSQVLQTLAKYKTFVYPSLSEGLPLSVLEAASCGLNLILSDIPQHKILHFPSVYYINPLSFNLKINFGDEDGILNKRFTLENYSISRMVNGYIEIYNSLL